MGNQDKHVKDLNQHYRVTPTHQVGQTWWEPLPKVRCGAHKKHYPPVVSLPAREQLLQGRDAPKKGVQDSSVRGGLERYQPNSLVPCQLCLHNIHPWETWRCLISDFPLRIQETIERPSSLGFVSFFVFFPSNHYHNHF